MPLLFGAPNGIGAAEADDRQVVQGALQAQKTLGEIAMQPAQRSLAESHARLYAAEASQKEAAAKLQQQMAELGQRASASAASGTDLTVADLGKPRSQADALERMANLGDKEGMSPLALAPLRKEIAGIRQKEAMALSEQASMEERKARGATEKAERLGAMALAGMRNQRSYALVRMQLASGETPLQLPADFAQGREMLQTLADESVKAKDAIDLRRKERKEVAQEARWNSANAKDAATLAAAGVRKDLLQERLDQLRKNGGEGTPSQVAARNSLIQAREDKSKALDRKMFPALPVDPTAWKIGQQYTAANGAKILRVKHPVTGEGTFQILAPPPPVKKSPIKVPAVSIEDDETDDEGED